VRSSLTITNAWQVGLFRGAASTMFWTDSLKRLGIRSRISPILWFNCVIDPRQRRGRDTWKRISHGIHGLHSYQFKYEVCKSRVSSTLQRSITCSRYFNRNPWSPLLYRNTHWFELFEICCCGKVWLDWRSSVVIKAEYQKSEGEHVTLRRTGWGRLDFGGCKVQVWLTHFWKLWCVSLTRNG
jgi:hypothetical protein